MISIEALRRRIKAYQEKNQSVEVHLFIDKCRRADKTAWKIFKAQHKDSPILRIKLHGVADNEI